MKKYQIFGLSCLIFLGFTLLLAPPTFAQAANQGGRPKLALL